MARRPALTHEDNVAIERRLHAVHDKPRLALDDIDRVVSTIRHPEELRGRIGDPIRYSQRVEAEVAGLSIETLLPYATDDYDGRFLDVWVPDERGHGEALDRLARVLELPPEVPRDASTVPAHNRIAGLLGRRSAHAYEIVSMMYHSIGAMNERLALGAYTEMGRVAEGVGDPELAEVLFGHLRRDESAHLGYYRTYARQLRSRVTPWQLAITRMLIVSAYAPVGAGDHKDKPLLGRVLAALEDDPDHPDAGPLLQAIADELLAPPGTALKPFVARSLRRCLDAARAEATPRRRRRSRVGGPVSASSSVPSVPVAFTAMNDGRFSPVEGRGE